MQVETTTFSECKINMEKPEFVRSDPSERKTIDWRLYIHADSDILGGKPVVKGTRLSVNFILRLFANGWTFKEILESYPRLSSESLQAVFAYAGECLSEESLFFFPRGRLFST